VQPKVDQLRLHISHNGLIKSKRQAQRNEFAHTEITISQIFSTSDIYALIVEIKRVDNDKAGSLLTLPILLIRRPINSKASAPLLLVFFFHF